jgi:hypothetical protein
VLSDLTPVTIAEIGRQSGLGETATGTHMDMLSRNNIIPIVQQRVRNEQGAQPKRAKKSKAQPPGTPAPSPPEPEPAPPPPFIYKTYVKPIEGPDAPILNPAKIGPLTPSPRQEKRKQNAKEERADTMSKLDRLKVLEARCPECGEIDPNKLSLHCHNCGRPTIIAEMPDTKRTVKWATPRHKRKERPHPIDPDGNPLPSSESVHCTASETGQPALFPEPPAGPQVEVATGAELRAQQAAAERSSYSLSSSQQSVRSAAVQSTAKDIRNTEIPPIGGTEGVQCTVSDEVALDGAAELLLSVFGDFEQHIYMRRDGDPRGKYVTEHTPLTRERLIEHLTGKVTLGGRLAMSDLRAASGKRSQAWAWDTDEKDGWDSYHRMERAAYKLAAAGLRPLFIRNVAKEASAHLWVLADRPTDARHAQLACEVIAPELRTMRERFPDPEAKDGRRIRFPLGAYRPKEGPPVPVKVGYVRGPADMAWCDGTEPRAWAVLTSAISDAAILETTYIPVVCRDQPPPPKERRAARTGGRAGNFDFARFNSQNPIEGLADWVRVGAHQKCLAPWRNESQPSVALFQDGRWFDFGDERYFGRDAFDFWAAREGHFNPDNDAGKKVDFEAAFRALGVSPGEGRTQDAAPGAQLCFADDEQWDEA